LPVRVLSAAVGVILAHPALPLCATSLTHYDEKSIIEIRSAFAEGQFGNLATGEAVWNILFH
jgi:hypothetical protein